MKQTDYAPRAAPMDLYLKIDATGVEVGCDVGAHAESLLRYSGVKILHLVDIWENEFCRGYCEGRLHSQGFMNRVNLIHAGSDVAVMEFKADSLDFVYIDIQVTRSTLPAWWEVLKPGGVMGVRNYTVHKSAVMEFLVRENCTTKIDEYHNEIILWKV